MAGDGRDWRSMNVQELGELLALISVYDGRKPDEYTFAVWGAEMADIRYDDAKAAVMTHFRTFPDVWIKPGHVIGIIKSRTTRESSRFSGESWIVAEAMRSLRDPDDVDEYLRVLRGVRDALASGSVTSADVRALPSGTSWSPNHRARAREYMAAQIRDRGLGGRLRRKSERSSDRDISPTLKAARERARQEKKLRWRSGDPEAIGGLLGAAQDDLRRHRP